MTWIGLLPYTLVIINLQKSESQDERDRRAETRKRKREEILFDTNMEVGNDQEWDDNRKYRQSIVVDFFNQEE